MKLLKKGRVKYALLERSYRACSTTYCYWREKKQFFKQLHKLTGRNIVVYYSAWQQKYGQNGDFYIIDNDRNGFMDALRNLDKSKGLDLILHTPGGDLTATKSIVEYLKAYFNNDIRVIIPNTAMSAGTMIACSGKEIIMGLHSTLGPIDPQIMNAPAYEYLEMLNNALNDLNNNKNVFYWNTVLLSKYPPTFFGMCTKVIKLSERYVEEWLLDNMLKHDKTGAKRTTEYLANYHFHLQHGTRLHYNNLVQHTKLNITKLEDNPKFQELVLSIYHCYQILADRTPFCKIIENHNGLKFISSLPPNLNR